MYVIMRVHTYMYICIPIYIYIGMYEYPPHGRENTPAGLHSRRSPTASHGSSKDYACVFQTRGYKKGLNKQNGSHEKRVLLVYKGYYVRV